MSRGGARLCLLLLRSVEVSQLHRAVIAEEDCQRGTYYRWGTAVAPPNLSATSWRVGIQHLFQ
jgi:hypothetical protein